MNATLSMLTSKGYWKHAFSFRVLLVSLLAALGALWTLVEISLWYKFDTITNWLQARAWVFLGIGVISAVWENLPRVAVSCHPKNRDVKISIRIGDIFAGTEDLIVGCNTSFDTDIASGLISTKSIQGQFTSESYHQVAHLDANIAAALTNVTPSSTGVAKQGKTSVYPIGTTVKVQGKSRTAYLCGFAHMNAHGNAQASLDDLKAALPKLWEHITSAGNHGEVVTPILGSGLSRIPVKRQVLIQEILRSFISACSSQIPCSSLSIVILPKDYFEFGLDLDELGRFLVHLCTYTEFSPPGQVGAGQALPITQATAAVTNPGAVGAPTPP